MTFFDDSCSDCIMREYVPGVQWEGVVTKKGPYDEWMVLVPLANVNKQAVRCQSMTQDTADFPQCDTTRAVAEVKNNQPDNPKQQTYKVPAQIGVR